MAKIHTFKAGFCTHAACMAVRGAGFAQCEFPAQVFLLEAAGRFWLFDTGYAQHFLDATASGLFALYRKVTPVVFNESEAMRLQLREFGVNVADLSGVIVSHFHGDHIGGLKDFPHMPIIASGAGWQQVRSLRGVRALLQGFVPAVMPDDTDQRLLAMEAFERVALPSECAPLQAAYVLPHSQGEIFLVDLPGHAAGHMGALVACDDGWHLLAADAAWSRANYRDWKLPSPLSYLIMDKSSAFKHTLGQLQQLDALGKVSIHLSHEEG